MVINIFLAFLVYELAYKTFNLKNLKVFYKCIIWLIALNSIWLIFQALKIDPVFMNNGHYADMLVGCMGLKAFMGMFFALSIPFIARLNIWASIPLFLPIYLSECSVAVVAGGVSLLFTVYFKSKKIFLALLLVFLIGASAFVLKDTKTGMFHDRFSIWKLSTRHAFAHPVMGWGLDSFRNVGKFKPFIYIKNPRSGESMALPYGNLVTYQETGQMPSFDGFFKEGDKGFDPWDNPHNEFISLFYEFGLIGVFIIALLWINIFKRFQIHEELIPFMGFFIGVLIISTGQFPFHVVRLGLLIIVALGIYYKLTDEIKRSVLNGS